jgi:hypothetical protein
MAQKIDTDLQIQKQVIEGETTDNANTATRVGQMFEDVIDSKFSRLDDAYDGVKGLRAGVTAPASLKDIVTTTLTLGAMVMFTDSTASNVVRIYELTNETTAESSPTVIRPNDYAGTTNERVWRLRVTADIDSDTGNSAWGAISGTLADQTDLQTALGLKANLASPTFTGTPAAPTASAADNSTKLATTAYVDNAVAGGGLYVLDLATPSTAGGTITLDFNNQVQRMFVGSASFATPKTIALSNDTNGLVLNLVLTLTNVAAVLTFPSTFTMLATEGGARWNDGAKTFTPAATGKHEFSATWDGTDWNMKATTTYL